jgi:anion-transporting  ArsA/GET3 family ATPase
VTFDLDAVLETKRIVVCCGSGGVGKTTTAAAIALRAAERGRRVVVVTIDPARRLAQSLGLTELDNQPRLVERPAGGGELHAMMLDMKRTFDDIVLTHADPLRAKQILDNPFYVMLSANLAGTQEYMAMEKLGQLHATGEWDLIVVDTPPTRNALDFLDAPDRMTRFLEGRFLRLVLSPARVGGRFGAKLVNVGLNTFTGVITKITGAELLRDLRDFFAAFETMFGGFRDRARQTYRLLQDDDTAFVVVASPEPAALREAAYFVDRLSAEHMPLAGVVVNRVHRVAATQLSRDRAVATAEMLAERKAKGPAAGLLRLHADRMALANAEQRTIRAFAARRADVPFVEVPAMATDVHDVEGLRRIGAALAGAAAA